MNINFDIQNQLGRIIPAATIIFVAVVFFLVVVFAVSSGKQAAQAKVVLSNSQSISAALDFFYSDQQRYPSALEFANSSVMLNYLSQFLLHSFVSEACKESYRYQRPNLQDYELFFCLPRASGGFNSGWNKLVN